MANADLHRIRFITNRDDLGGDNDARFGGRVGAGLSVGAATVRLSDRDAPCIQTFAYETDRVSDVQVFGSESRGNACAELVAALARDLAPDNDVLLFVHGFDTNFRQALCYAAQIEVQLRKRFAALRGHPNAPSVPGDLSVVAVTWPSDGGPLKYLSDRGDAKDSGPPFSAAIDAVKACREQSGTMRRRVHLHCQSMGARVLAFTLGELRRTSRLPTGSRLFDVAAFSGADVGDDALTDDSELAGFETLCGQINVYHNSGDMLGLVSRLILFRKPMSRYGARVPSQVANVDVLDVSRCIERERDRFGHYYARVNKHVQTDWALSICGADRTVRPTRRSVGPSTPRYEIVLGSGVGID